MHSLLLIYCTITLALRGFASAHTIRLTEHGSISVHPVTGPHKVHDLQRHLKLTPKPANAGPPHHKRNEHMYQLPSGWNLHLQASTSFLPISIATATLSIFYHDIMAFAIRAAEEAEEEVTDLAIQFGNLLLEFFTSEELIPVSWELVHDFAKVMLEMTDKGFTGAYQAVLRAGANVIMVRVGMRTWRFPAPATAA